MLQARVGIGPLAGLRNRIEKHIKDDADLHMSDRESMASIEGSTSKLLNYGECPLCRKWLPYQALQYHQESHPLKQIDIINESRIDSRLRSAHEDQIKRFKNIPGLSSLFWTAKNGYEKPLRQLLARAGAIADERNGHGGTPLSLAAGNGHEEVVDPVLAQPDIRMNSQDLIHRTPLIWAAEKGHEVIVKLLLEKGAELECKDSRVGRTPLS